MHFLLKTENKNVFILIFYSFLVFYIFFYLFLGSNWFVFVFRLSFWFEFLIFCLYIKGSDDFNQMHLTWYRSERDSCRSFNATHLFHMRSVAAYNGFNSYTGSLCVRTYIWEILLNMLRSKRIVDFCFVSFLFASSLS